ncbi:MAG: Bax inhibitor-1/YccA family protein [Armatimonadetes bacterium]|nr:Bax inhibitor-1/YccA family protein [Armatimonadota bacterium]
MSDQRQNPWIRSSNPTTNERAFDRMEAVSSEPMTVRGAIQKTGILLALLIPCAVVGFIFPNMLAAIAAALVAFGLAIAIAFKPNLAPSLAPAYAVLEGYFVGAVSFMYTVAMAKSQYANAVPIASAGTMVTLGIMLLLYTTRVIKVTETLRGVVIGLTCAVAIFYLISLVASLLMPGVPQTWAMHGSGPIGIGFSVFVIGLAAFNFLLDFDFIERGVERGMPKQFEWYAGFGILVTIVWLYLEILRLLSKLSKR